MRFNKEWIIIAMLGALVLALSFSDQITQLFRKTQDEAVNLSEETAPEDPDARLIRLAKDMTVTPPAGGNTKEQATATLGRRLFFDTRFSANNSVACATCHDPQRSFTDGRTVAHGVSVTTANTPTVLNAFTGSWFMWDGRADSLESQALKPIENPLEHGISRGRVAQLLWQHYRDEIEGVMGPFPPTLARLFSTWGERPFEAVPASTQLILPLELAAYAIATVGSFDIQQRFILEANSANESPQMTLARASFAEPAHEKAWTTQWKQLSTEQQRDVNRVFAAFGEAVAAYERGIVAHESPFDGFIARVQKGTPPETARGEGFGAAELNGFRFFVQRECVACHNGPMLSDQQFHNIGLPQYGEQLDIGRARGLMLLAADPFNCAGGILPATETESCRELPYLDNLNLENVGARKTPTLRNITETAPYMHDGRFATLDDVLNHYNALELEPAVGHREETLKPLRMSSEERENLKAFLRSLTSPVRDLTSADQTKK